MLRDAEKEKANFLARRTIIGKNWHDERTSNYLSEIQQALTNFQVLTIDYQKDGANNTTTREVEPFAIYHNTAENWVLIAWCRLRQNFRNFRLDRIQKLVNKQEQFPPHELTLEEYVGIQKEKYQ